MGGYLVENMGVGFEGAEAMSKSNRDQQLLAVVRRQRLRNPFAVCGRAAPQIDGDIKMEPRSTRTSLSWAAGLL